MFLFDLGKLPEQQSMLIFHVLARMAFLVAVVRLAMGKDLIGNCTHEPNLLGAVSGANLFWAEVGANPRDTETETSRGRGLNMKSCIEMFREADFDVLKGPSVIYSKNGFKSDS